MKHKSFLLTLAVTALALGLAGCSKNESVTPTAEDATKAAVSAAAAKTADAAKAEAEKAAAAAKVEAAKVAEAAKAEAEKAAAAAKVAAAKVDAEKAAEAARVEAAKTADAAKAAANTKVQGFIDKAKSLIAESKFSDASGVLQQLTGLSLTSEQTKLVDDLKEQIQKALAAKTTADAGSAVGNLINK